MVKSTLQPAIDLLKEVSLLRKFTPDELQLLIQVGMIMTYEAHTNIVIEGELTWGIYLILEGSVGIYKMNKMNAQQCDVGQLHAGTFFGEMSLIDESPRTATVQTLNDTTVFYISKQSFNQFLDQGNQRRTRFYESCVKDLVHRLRELGDNYVISQYQLWKSTIKKEVA